MVHFTNNGRVAALARGSHSRLAEVARGASLAASFLANRCKRSNKSYFVKNSDQHSKFYRLSEPVSVYLTGPRRQSSQYITLDSTEWTSYTISSDTARDYQVTVRAKAAKGPTTVELTVGDKVRTVTLPDTGWNEITVGTLPLSPGENRLKWAVKSGSADLAWIEVSPADNGQRAAGGSSVNFSTR